MFIHSDLCFPRKMQLFCLAYALFCSLLVSVKGTPKITILIEAITPLYG